MRIIRDPDTHHCLFQLLGGEAATVSAAATAVGGPVSRLRLSVIIVKLWPLGEEQLPDTVFVLIFLGSGFRCMSDHKNLFKVVAFLSIHNCDNLQYALLHVSFSDPQFEQSQFL